MKPLRLKMYGVGPYAREVDIDFAQLNNVGLFLITGATGAGKTSIFDGITYALYGETNLKDDDKKNGIICDYLENDEHKNTYVEFIFEVDGIEYVVKRIPSHYKYKKNGERNKSKEGEKLEIEATPSKKIPGKKEDRDKYIREEIMKVDASQFKKLIMLPQGAFSEFIRSNSKAKKETLEKIFDTAIYEKISDKLKKKVKDLSVGIESESNDLFSKLGTLEIEQDRWKELLKDKILSFDELEEIIEGSQERLLEVNRDRTEEVKEIDIESLIAKITKGKSDNKIITDLEGAKRSLGDLEDKKEEIDSKRLELSKHRRAKDIDGEYTVKEKDTKNYVVKEKEYTKGSEELDEYKYKNDGKIEALEEEKKSLKKLEEKVNTLDTLKSDVENYLNLSKELVNKRNKLTKLEETDLVESKKQEKELLLEEKNLEKERKSINKELEKSSELKLEKQERKNREKVLKELDDKHKDIEEARRELFELEEKLKNLESEERLALKEYRDQSEVWFQAEAYKLSDRLEDGKACLVCGSKEHPKKAEKPEGVPTKKELEKLEKNYEKAGTEKNNLNGKISSDTKTINKSIKELESKMVEEGISDEANLKKAIDENKNRLKTLKETIDKMSTKESLEKVEKKIDKNTKDMKSLMALKQKLESDIASLKTEIKLGEKEISRLKSNFETKEIEVDNFEKEYKDMETQKNNKKNQVEDIEKLRDEKKEMESRLRNDLQTLKELKKSMEESMEIFEDKLSKKDFEDEKEFLRARDINSKDLEGQINTYDNQLIRVKAIIEEKKEYEGTKVIDLEDLEKKKSLVEERVKQLNKEIGENNSKCEGLEKMKQEIKRAQKKIGREEGVLKVYKKLSEISEGRYGEKKNNITFQNYVLGVYFEEVLDRANERFRKMTSNQYEMILHRKEKSGKGEAGLDINVFDSHTGRERSIKTLSGGETFKASMALALGMSDVVQGQNGGIRLDSVFIDEGFGTLDDESLSVAMDILMELKSSGRTVGIISHVNELKQTITSQIRVEKTNRGSKVEVVM